MIFHKDIIHIKSKLHINQKYNICDNLFYIFILSSLFISIIFYWGKSYDDVFLAFRYAQNIERGYGFVFNQGEHFLGTPAPLFILLLLILHKIFPFFTIPQVATIISCTGLYVCGYMMYNYGKLLNQRLTGFIACIFIIFNPFTLTTLGGETPLYLAFISSAIFAYLTSKYTTSSILLGLALMNRTEAFIPIGILLTLYLIENRKIPIAMLLTIFSVISPWIIFAICVFGSPLTNSFTAKIAQFHAGAQHYPFGLIDWAQRIFFKPYSLFLCTIPLLIFGIIVLIFAAKPWRIVVAWTVLQTIAYSLLPIPFYHWYAAQVGVCIAVLIALGTIHLPHVLIQKYLRLQEETESKPKTRGNIWKAAYISTIIIVILMLPLSIYQHLNTAYSYYKAWPHGPANNIYTKTGQWFAANSQPNAKIAYLEIGQIAFYSDRYIIDTLGLISPNVYQQVDKKNWLWPILHYKPDYIIYNPLFKDWTDSDAVFGEEWFIEGFHKVDEIKEPPYPATLAIYQRNEGTTIPDPTERGDYVDDTDHPIGEIYKGHNISQTFTTDNQTISAIAIKFATYNNKSKGNITIKLLDQDKSTIQRWQISSTNIQDNQWLRLYMKHDYQPKRTTLTISVESDAPDKDSAITIWASKETMKSTYIQYKNKIIPGTLNYALYHREEN